MANLSAVKLPNGTKVNIVDNTSGFVTTDTKNTAGITRNTSDKLYLVGAPYSANAYAQTYTNANIYYQNGFKSYAMYGEDKEARVLSYIDTGNSNTPVSNLYACNSTCESYAEIKPDLLKLISVGPNSSTKMEFTDESFALYDDDGEALIEMDSWDGDLYLRGVSTPTSNYHAANKLYVDNAISGRVPTSRTVNGKALSSNISLTASDVGALPSSTVIPTVNNATLTIQKNGTNVNTFTANASTDVTANITVPTKTSDLTNDNSVKSVTESPSTALDGTIAVTTGGENGISITSYVPVKGVALQSNIPTAAGSNTTGISVSDHSTSSIYGVQSSTTTASKVTLGTALSVTGVSGSTTASKVTVGSHSTDYGVEAAGSGSFTSGAFSGGSGSFSATVTDHVLSFSHSHTAATHEADSHSHTAPTLGSKVPTVSASDVTVPKAATSATSIPNVTAATDVTVPIKDLSSTTVVTGESHTVTDNGHTHTLS